MPFINSLFAKQLVSFRHEIYFSHSGAIDLCFLILTLVMEIGTLIPTVFTATKYKLKGNVEKEVWETCSWLQCFIILHISGICFWHNIAHTARGLPLFTSNLAFTVKKKSRILRCVVTPIFCFR
jgi:hypothetical protein